MTPFTPVHSRQEGFRCLPMTNGAVPFSPRSPNAMRVPVLRAMSPGGFSNGSYSPSPFVSPTKPRFPSTPVNFAPITNEVASGSGYAQSSPYKVDKLSPATIGTATTLDSSFDTIPTIDSPSHFQSSRGLKPVWIPPKDISVCRILETSFDAQVSQRRSPSFGIGKKRSSWPRGDDDAVRKSRIKTELCMHYENGTPCPFGENCTYAHGEEELQMTKLMDLHRAGLVDLDTYRTKPCLTWICTGSCPFGKRCSGIHDPRVAGTQQSWLPHTETQGNTIATDINVEALHQKRLNEILYNNPFGENFSVDRDDYDALYKLVCNTQPFLGKKRCAVLKEHHKIDIALQMRGPPGWNYKFRPQHVIYDELCMVIQKRAFRLTERKAVEIPLSSCQPSKSSFTDVIVREIAFGPDSDSSVRGVALWFDISDSDVTVCTPQQAKRFRWKKGLKNRRDTPSPTVKKLSFENKECFTMVRPYETDAYKLATEMLVHRLGTLRAELVAKLTDRSIALKTLEIKDAQLRITFAKQMRHWITWAWPINHGRAHVDETTPVPPVDGVYAFRGEYNEASFSPEPAVKRIWESFVACEHDGEGPVLNKAHQKTRLASFEILSYGNSLDDESFSELPHIKKSRVAESAPVFNEYESERCWKALLLKPKHEYETNEWETVREHFENSRSTKVLSILQQ